MAYVTRIYSNGKPVASSGGRNHATSNGVKKYTSGGISGGSAIGVTRRRLFHICCGILLGILLGYSIGNGRRRWNSSECVKLSSKQGAAGGKAIGSDGSLLWRNDYYPDESGAAIEDELSTTVGAGGGNKSGGRVTTSSLLFVGVMTAQKYLDTRAVAVYRTWGKELPGKMAFFSSAFSKRPKNAPDLPLVPLKGVDDSYPPQKKSFMMLQYMWEHFGDKFEWFMRADDDLYVRPDRVESFLRSVDSGKPHFIGQAGRGNQEEFGLLSLEYDENFCMGGPGIIMSRQTLRQVALNVKHCLRNLYTTHEDVELGRCVQKFAKISCTWSYEMQSIFYHNSSGDKAFTGNLKQKEVHRAITLHPVKQYEHMYRIHNYMRGLKIHELLQKKISLHRDVYLTSQLLKLPPSLKSLLSTNRSASSSSSRPVAKKNRSFEISRENENENDMYETSLFGLKPGLNKFHPREENDVFVWDMISRSIFSAANVNPRRRIESYLKEGLEDVIREVMDNINTYSRERGRVIEFQQILYGYYRINPLYGPDYILDILLTYKKYRGRKMTVPVRRHAYIQQQFAGLEVREVANGEEVRYNVPEENGGAFEDSLSDDKEFSKFSKNQSPMMFLLPRLEEMIITKDINNNNNNNNNDGYSQKLINFILPLSGRYQTFVRFMSTYENVCLRRNENVALYVVLFTDASNNTSSDYDRVLASLRSVYLRTNNGGDSRTINLVPVYDKFSRAAALDYGMNRVKSGNDDDLLLLIDVDMVWTSDTLSKIRSNTIKGQTAYFPIVFSEYDPLVVYDRQTSPNHFMINDESGYWRQFGFGIVSMYKEDILRVGGFNTSIHGWGKEDVDFFEKLVGQQTATNVTIFRAADPHLVHVFHIVNCDPTLDANRLVMCRNTRSETYGSVNQLANLVYKNKKTLFDFAASKIQRPTKPT